MEYDGFRNTLLETRVRVFHEILAHGRELAREAAICSRLNHPAVLRMYDFFEYEHKLVLVLEPAEASAARQA